MRVSVGTFALVALGLAVIYVSSSRLFAPLEPRTSVAVVAAGRIGSTSARAALGFPAMQEASEERLRQPRLWRAGGSMWNATSAGYGAAHPRLAVMGSGLSPGVELMVQPPPYIVLGVATSPKNEGHRSWIRRTWMTLPNIQRSVHAVFLLGVLTSEGVTHPPALRAALRGEQAVHRDMLFLNARETKPPGEKMVAFFRWCVTAYGVDPSRGPNLATRYCVKTDDDAYVHTMRLEVNLRALWAQEEVSSSSVARTQVEDSSVFCEGPTIYMGATLWASYIESSFEVCGHGMGPVSAWGQAAQERCAARGGIGPFPYVAGTLEVMSMPLACWLTRQPAVARFVQRAHATTPPRWTIGEDTVLGMWVFMSPFRITALHWGWDKIHDLCFLCKDKTQLWKPVTDQSVVIHLKGHQANQENFDNVHRNITERCNQECMRQENCNSRNRILISPP